MHNIILLKAAYFAAEKHKTQKRKGADSSPYINHPLSVATMIAEIGGVTDTEILTAAILHDTIEDTETSHDELLQLYGKKVTDLVLEVTDDKSLPKEERKRLQIDHASSKSNGATLIKLADKISNVLDVTNNPPSNWDLDRRGKYLEWAESVVNNLPEVNEPLKTKFYTVLAAGKKKLGKVDF